MKNGMNTTVNLYDLNRIVAMADYIERNASHMQPGELAARLRILSDVTRDLRANYCMQWLAEQGESEAVA